MKSYKTLVMAVEVLLVSHLLTVLRSSLRVFSQDALLLQILVRFLPQQRYFLAVEESAE